MSPFCRAPRDRTVRTFQRWRPRPRSPIRTRPACRRRCSRRSPDATPNCSRVSYITELDVDVLPRPTRQNTANISAVAAATAESNPYTAGLPEEMQQALARRYAELFEVFVQHRNAISRVTFWGVTDGDSWLNNFPTRGRTNYPLLFDRAGKPKPAFDAVLQKAKTK